MQKKGREGRWAERKNLIGKSRRQSSHQENDGGKTPSSRKKGKKRWEVAGGGKEPLKSEDANGDEEEGGKVGKKEKGEKDLPTYSPGSPSVFGGETEKRREYYPLYESKRGRGQRRS